jgi:hypothetical protein
MTLLGFAVGTASSAPPVNMSLGEFALEVASRSLSLIFDTFDSFVALLNKFITDEIIKARKKEAARPVKSVSNADRSIATSRAKRDAKMNARRGITTSDKPTAMQVEKEVQAQHKQTIAKKAAAIEKEKKSKKPNNPNETATERAKTRRRNRQITQEAKKNKLQQQQKKAPANTSGGKALQTAVIGRPPSKKAIKAAVAAMEEKGFQMPPGMQMVISFAPKPNAPNPPKSTAAQAAAAPKGNDNNNNPPSGNAGKGGRGRGRGKK